MAPSATAPTWSGSSAATTIPIATSAARRRSRRPSTTSTRAVRGLHRLGLEPAAQRLRQQRGPEFGERGAPFPRGRPLLHARWLTDGTRAGAGSSPVGNVAQGSARCCDRPEPLGPDNPSAGPGASREVALCARSTPVHSRTPRGTSGSRQIETPCRPSGGRCGSGCPCRLSRVRVPEERRANAHRARLQFPYGRGPG